MYVLNTTSCFNPCIAYYNTPIGDRDKQTTPFWKHWELWSGLYTCLWYPERNLTHRQQQCHCLPGPWAFCASQDHPESWTRLGHHSKPQISNCLERSKELALSCSSPFSWFPRAGSWQTWKATRADQNKGSSLSSVDQSMALDYCRKLTPSNWITCMVQICSWGVLPLVYFLYLIKLF